MKINREQAEQLNKVIRQQLNYLGRLQARLVDVGFPANDKLLQTVRHAYDATHSLSVELHYLSCAGGVWREPDRDEPPKT